ncbi:MAG TPA: TIM barrel protein, partial [Planctomycetota bacterium]|nr:TIM barrel protein [Planctomycetota bacterium]
MSTRCSRREFLAASAAGAGLLAVGRADAAPFKTKLHKAVILGANRMNEETFKKLKDTGLEGIEAHTVAVDEAKKARELAEKAGLRIHSVMRGGSAAGLRAAQAYGADAVLAPVGGCGAKPIPQPWEFDIKFDESNGHITQLVAGDNEKFKGYIEAHNRSVDGVRESIKKLLPVAEETKVAIALENVWNNWCVRPELYNWVVASFNSPWVKAYFDVGNHVKYAGILRGDKVEIAYLPEV